MTPKQIEWLEKATQSDLLKAKILKGWDYKTYKEIEGAWHKIHNKELVLSEKWFHSDGWR